MKLLITGGAGFIGSHFIYHELETHPEDDVVCFDALTYAGNLASLAAAREYPRYRFIHGDICDAACVNRVFREERPDAVVHFAAETHIDRSIAAPGIFLHTNAVGTQVLLDACRRLDVKRFHLISTDEVYGELPLDHPADPFIEESPLRASNPYAVSKASADLLVQAYDRTYQLPVSITRASNNYGPFQHPEKLIPLTILRALANERIPVYGNGENVRGWLFVRDHCEAIDRVVRRGVPGSIYNVCGHDACTNIDVVRAILSELGKPEALIEYMPARPGYGGRHAVDSSHIKADLAWSPTVSFEQGLTRTVRWYKDHEDWWQAAYVRMSR